MYRKIRITVASMAVVVLCLLSSTGTLAYFMDIDSVTNNFTVGNASTALTIYDGVSGEERRVFDIDTYLPLVDRDIPFYLQAVNDGNISVFQRFRVVIPIALAQVVTLNLPTMNEGCVVVTTSENTCSNDDYTVFFKPSVNIEDTPTYAEYYIVSRNELAVGDATKEWPTMGLHIDGIAGVDRDLLECDGGVNNCVMGVRIYSDSVQTTGFANAVSAFNETGERYE